MKRKILLFIVIAILSLSLQGCANEKATITTTVYPVKYLVEQLAGERVDIEYISSDDFIQRTKLVSNYKDILSKTTLLVYIGELEPYFDMYSTMLENYNFDVINLASLSAIYDFKRYTRVDAGGVTVTKESSYYDGELFENIDVYSKDPFIWLDPIAMSSMARTITDWLCKYYPEDTLVFENNFKTLQQQFVRMDAEYQELNKLKDIKIATVTASFGNWQKQYGIQVYPLVLSKYGVLPSEEQIKEIENVIKNENVKYIAYDSSLPEDMKELYDRVKTDLNLKEIKLSSLSRLSEEDLDKNKTYTTIMYENLTNIENIFK